MARSRVVTLLVLVAVATGCASGSAPASDGAGGGPQAAAGAPPDPASVEGAGQDDEELGPILSTLPRSSWNPRVPVHNTVFGRLDSREANELGQTIRIERAFELRSIELYVESNVVFALPTFFDFPYDTPWPILRQHTVAPGPVDDLGVDLSLVLYRSPSAEGFPTTLRSTSGHGSVPQKEREVIRVAELDIVSDQPLVGRIRAGTGTTRLDLTEPVVLDPGPWLIALRVDGVDGDLELLSLPIRGMQAGEGVEIDVPARGPCQYRPTEDAYPDGAAYWRDEYPEAMFIPAYAKVAQCIEIGIYGDEGVMNPGDIGLDLFGVPVG